MSKKFDFAIAVSFTIAWLYLLGTIFNQSYFKSLGLTGYGLQHGFEDVLLNGFGVLFSAGASWMLKFALMLEIVILLAMVWGGIKVNRRIRTKIRAVRMSVRRNKSNDIRQKIADGVDQEFKRSTRYFLPLIFVLGAFFVMFFQLLCQTTKAKF